MHSSYPIAWHSRSPNLCTLALAERLRRTPDRLDPKGVSGPHRCVGERHLRHVLLCYVIYYNTVRTHLSLDKDAPIQRPPQTTGRIRAQPVLGGLHHQYVDLRQGEPERARPAAQKP